MEILFTTTTSVLSNLIRRITKEPVSHCAIKIGEFVVHSNLLGVRIDPYSKFIKKSKVVFQLSATTNNGLVHKTLEKYHGRPYDFFALLFLGLRYIFPKLMPKQNLWETTGMFICTEFITQVVDGKEDHLITPYQLYLKLLNENK